MFNRPIRYTAFFLALTFIIFSLLQYNDPDPHIWIPVYGIAALISISVGINRINIPVMLIAMIFYFIGAIFMWPATYEGVTLDMGYKIEIEEARESLGLLICGLAMAFYLFVSYRRNRRIKSF